MSIYRCGYCEKVQDADFDGCYEHPTDECECLCENCFLTLAEDEKSHSPIAMAQKFT